MSESVRMASGSGAHGFPALKIRTDDVSASFAEWLEDFELSIEMKALEMGTEEKVVDSVKTEVSKFTENARRMILLKCIGAEGRKVLTSAGYTKLTSSQTPTYAEVMTELRKQFEKTENRYVNVQKFVTVRQSLGEDYSAYLLRVESLSRSVGMFEHKTEEVHKFAQGIRSDLALVLAVNGLRDQTLCRQLIATDDLDWKKLGDMLRSRSSADDAVDKLHPHAERSAREYEVNAVSQCSRGGRSARGGRWREGSDEDRGYKDRESGSRPTECYGCGRFGHTLQQCPDTECFRCRDRGHLGKRCRASRCARCGGQPHDRGSRCRESRSPSPYRRSGISFDF